MHDFACIQYTYPHISDLYIPLKVLPGKGVEGPFLISLRLKTGPAAVCPVNNHIIGLIPAVFNLIEVKTGIKC